MAAATQIELLAFDAGYLSALRQGNAETERHFFEYFTPLIRAKLRKHLRTPELIEEATQETFMRVLAALRSNTGVRHPERFGAFVHAVSRNVALEIWRVERRFAHVDDGGVEDLELGSKADGPFRSPHAMAEADEARVRVRQVLADLSNLDRQLLEAVFLDEEDRTHVCLRMGVTRGHLRVLLHRASQRFRAAMLQERSSQMKRPCKGKLCRPQRHLLIALGGGKARSAAL
jgi:RNA polymerase sigma-70 factor (ECF subfamily)